MKVKSLKNKVDIISVYDEIAEGYVHWRARAWPIVKLVKGRRISDLGSGSCVNGAEVIRRGNAEYAVCLDISVKMLEIGQRVYGGKLLIDFVAGDMRNLPFREKSFDSIISIAALHHFNPREIKIVLSEISRVLRSLGLIVVTTWSPWQVRFLIQIIRNYLIRIMNPYMFPRRVLVPWRRKGVSYLRVYYLYTLNELRNMVVKYVRPRALLYSTYSKSRKIKAPHNNLIIALK